MPKTAPPDDQGSREVKQERVLPTAAGQSPLRMDQPICLAWRLGVLWCAYTALHMQACGAGHLREASAARRLSFASVSVVGFWVQGCVVGVVEWLCAWTRPAAWHACDDLLLLGLQQRAFVPAMLCCIRGRCKQAARHASDDLLLLRLGMEAAAIAAAVYFNNSGVCPRCTPVCAPMHELHVVHCLSWKFFPV